jgi:hypothetical protein
MGFAEEQVLLVEVQPISDTVEALQSGDRLTP